MHSDEGILSVSDSLPPSTDAEEALKAAQVLADARAVRYARDFLDRVTFANWSPTEAISARAITLYLEYAQLPSFSSRQRDAFLACALYEACRRENVPVTLRELQAATGVRLRNVVRIQRSMGVNRVDVDDKGAVPASLITRYGYYIGLTRCDIALLLQALDCILDCSDRPPRVLAAALVTYFKRCTTRKELRIKRDVCPTFHVSYPPVRDLALTIERDFGSVLRPLFLSAMLPQTPVQSARVGRRLRHS